MVTDEHDTARLTIHLLGSWQVLVDGRPAASFKYDKVRALLAFLVMETERPHRRERIAGLLWPDSSDDAARKGLRQCLATLRGAIDDAAAMPPHLLSSRESLAFNPDSDYQVDAVQFQTLIETSRQHRHRRLASCPACLERLAQAGALYQGDLLAHFSLPGAPAFESWLTRRREHLARLALDCFHTLAEHALRRADWPAAQAHARRQLALEPWRETAHRQLMLALAQDGQRAAALAHFQQCSVVLADELGMAPEYETLALHEQIKLGAVAAPEAVRPSPPAAAYYKPDLVGRERELAQLLDLIARPETRLLTITGPGGVGKTHLAVVLAEQARPYFGDGVAFASLVALEHTSQLPDAIAAAVDLRFQGARPPENQLFDYLAGREMLLVLDNFEQIAGEPTLLAELCRRAPGLMLLVTSRHRLKLRLEQLFPLQGLPFPDDDGQSGETAEPGASSGLEAYAAVRLFVRQARRLRPNFRLGAAARQPVVEICRLAEGVPLVLELAAAMCVDSSPADIAARLAAGSVTAADGFADLPARQRSLAATLDYAWQLLTAAERHTFSGLSVFQGSFDQSAAAAVTGAESGQLQALVHKSLLRESGPGQRAPDPVNHQSHAPGSERVFTMHPLARRYAHQKLADQSQAAAQHAAYFLALVAEHAPALADGASATAARLGLARHDIRRAWRWAMDHMRPDLLALAVEGLAAYLMFAGLYLEVEATFGAAAAAMADRPALAAKLRLAQAGGRQKLGDYQGALDLVDQALGFLDAAGTGAGGEETAVLRARAHIQQGHLLELQGQYEAALEQLKLTQDVLPVAYQGPERTAALNRMGSLYWRSSQYQRASDAFQAAMALDAAAGRQGRIAHYLGNLGLVYKDTGDYEQALDHLRRALAAAEAQGHREDIARFSLNIGLVYWQTGRLDEATDHYQRALALARALKHKRGTATSLVNLGVVERLRGRYEAALGTYREGLALARELGEKALEATLLGNTGNVYMDMGRFEQAADFLQRAVAIDRELGNEDGVARHLGNLGDLHKYTAEYGTAAACFDEAQHLLRQSGNKYYLCWVLVAGAEVALAQAGDGPDRAGWLAQAAAMNEEGGALAETIGRREYAFSSRILNGRLLVARGGRARARAYLEELLEAAEGPEEEAAVCFALWQVSGEEEARARALARYQALAAEMPKALFRSRVAALETG